MMMMDRFLPKQDELTELIQEQATQLYNRLNVLNIDSLKLPYHCQEYFKSSHSTRLFFSIETSAHLLYRAIRMSGKPVSEIILMDYGAGVGTLYLLAKMTGCKMVLYNDHLQDWKISAEKIARVIDVPIDKYIVGDIDECLQLLNAEGIDCDIIASRNVIEHIYSLKNFFNSIYRQQSQALIFSSTTANHKNPAARLKHSRWHQRWEKEYYKKRLTMAQKSIPDLSADRLQKIAHATRGLAGMDLQKAFDNYKNTGSLPPRVVYATNTCDPETGTWAEHIIPFEKYRLLINEEHYTINFEPGFWDTHYQSSYKNTIARILNRLISRRASFALVLAPFIYVIAKPLKK